MEPHEDNNADQQVYNNYIDFDPDDSQVQEAGTWSQLVHNEFQLGLSADQYEPYYNLLQPPDSLDDTPDIPSLEQVQEIVDYVGLENGERSLTFAPNIRVSDPVGALVNYNHGRPSNEEQHEPLQQLSIRQDPYTTLVPPSRGPPSQWTTSTTATDESSYLGDGSTAASGAGIAPPTADTAHSNSRPASVGYRSDKYKCNHADCAGSYKLYDTMSALKKHARSHEPDEEKRFVCEMCPKRWLYKKDLKRHRLTHFEAQEECPDCGARLQRKDNVRRHQRDSCRGSTSSGPLERQRTTLSQIQVAPHELLPAVAPNNEPWSPPPSSRKSNPDRIGRYVQQEHVSHNPAYGDSQAPRYLLESPPYASQDAWNDNGTSNPQRPVFTSPPSANHTFPANMRSFLDEPEDVPADRLPTSPISPSPMERSSRNRTGSRNAQ